MFKFALILSTIPSENLFRAALTKSFHSGRMNNFLICSGFFHERTNTRGPFYASQAFTGAILPSNSSVTVVGAYNPSSHEFSGFANQLATQLKTIDGSLVTVEKRRAHKRYANKWHAKIFIAKQKQKYRFAVIGSSNLTRNAFSVTASNNEADVIIWDDLHGPTKRLVNSIISSVSEETYTEGRRPSVYVSDYSKTDPRNSESGSMEERLDGLWKDIIIATEIN